MKTAVIILTDPKAGTDESVARLLNALALADEARRSGDTVEIAFAGSGTRWPAELTKPTHPAHARYQALRELVRGASRSCAARHETTCELETAGIALVGDNAVAGTPGVLSLRRYYAEGWNVALF